MEVYANSSGGFHAGDVSTAQFQPRSSLSFELGPAIKLNPNPKCPRASKEEASPAQHSKQPAGAA
jgi:hypothetical protein